MALDRIVAYCGLVCSSCPILLATQKDDDEERKRVAELVKKQYGKECTAEDINCDGCLTEGPRIWKLCFTCPIRKCARQRNAKNCVHCTEYPCGTLTRFFKETPEAKETLDKIRSELNPSKF
jgi:hypothetical protein